MLRQAAQVRREADSEPPLDGRALVVRQSPLEDAEADGLVFDQARKMDALLLGRHTYDIFAGFWPTAPAEMDWTRLLNRVPK